MRKRLIFACLVLLGSSLSAQGTQTIVLKPPDTTRGIPVMKALSLRASQSEFDSADLSLQDLSDLLWAANGINRPDVSKRTAPSAMNWQEIDIYVTLPEGAFVWDAKANTLNPVASADLRATTGTQPFPATAPVNLVYVADMTKAGRPATDPQQLLNIGADAGFIAGHAYLYCASAGLATVVRASVPKEALAKALKLRETQTIVLAQTVGYPKK